MIRNSSKKGSFASSSPVKRLVAVASRMIRGSDCNVLRSFHPKSSSTSPHSVCRFSTIRTICFPSDRSLPGRQHERAPPVPSRATRAARSACVSLSSRELSGSLLPISLARWNSVSSQKSSRLKISWLFFHEPDRQQPFRELPVGAQLRGNARQQAWFSPAREAPRAGRVGTTAHRRFRGALRARCPSSRSLTHELPAQLFVGLKRPRIELADRSPWPKQFVHWKLHRPSVFIRKVAIKGDMVIAGNAQTTSPSTSATENDDRHVRLRDSHHAPGRRGSP